MRRIQTLFLAISMAVSVTVVGVGIAVTPAPAMAQTAEETELSLDELRTRAEAGDPDAQYEVGYAYFTGNGTKQSYKRARKWYERAAKQGHAGAQFNLGLIYLDGIGTSRRDILGLAWMYVAATQTDTANGRIAQAFVEKFEAEMAEWAKLGWDDSVIIFGKEKAEELASEIKAER
ncbi:MAG: sel1 repeat family protein [Proteobacteria bacterium]|nr:sel1 repeat family protein [Pseudomonadota bacterium]